MKLNCTAALLDSQWGHPVWLEQQQNKTKEEREVVGVVVHPMEIEELEPKRQKHCFPIALVLGEDSMIPSLWFIPWPT